MEARHGVGRRGRRGLFQLICAAACASSAHAGIIYQSATIGPSQGGGPGVAPEQYLGVRFQVTSTTTASSIGGHFLRYYNGGASETTAQKQLFGAVIALSGSTDVPDSTNLSTPDVKATTLFIPVLVPYEASGSADVTASITPTTLTPGWYALVFGSGLFGAQGRGSAAENNTVVGTPSYFFRNTSYYPNWTNDGMTATRFFINDANVQWNNAAGGAWSTGGNWSPTNVPTSLADANFPLNSAGGYTVTLSGASVAKSLVVKTDKPTISLGANTLSLAGDLILAQSASETGSLTLTGSGGTMSVAGNAKVGEGGTGVLTVNTGATLTVANTLHVYNTGASAPAGTKVSLNGGRINAASLDTHGNNARFSWSSGTLNLTGGLTISPSGPLGSALALGSGMKLIAASTVAAGSSMTVSGGELQATSINNAGTFTFSSGTLSAVSTLTNSGVANFNADAGENLSINATAGNVSFASTQHLSSLTLGSGASASLTAGGDKVLLVNSLSIPGGTLDVRDNDVIVRGASYGAVESLVISGFGNFDWQGTGITSSTAATFAQSDGSRAVGVINNADWGHGTFAGETVSGVDILVKYTWTGDANVDGLVDNDDFGQFLYGYSGAGAAVWLNGDFDYNGVVDNDDFGWFLAGFGAFNASGNMQLSEDFKSQLAEFASANGLPLVLPEPTLLAPLAAAALFAGRRRRRAALRA